MNMLLLLAALAANSPPASPLDDQAFAIGKQLRCPVCQGMPIAESPSTMAQDMMKRVREMLAEGQDRDAILTFFVARYGQWVVLEPPKHGFGLWVWLLPPAMLVLAVVLALRTMRRLRARAIPAPPAVAESSSLPAASADPYLQAIRDEVRR